MSNSNHVCERVFREILQGKLPCATLRTRCPSLKSPGWGRELGQEPVVRWHRMFDLKKGLQRAVWGKELFGAKLKWRCEPYRQCVYFISIFLYTISLLVLKNPARSIEKINPELYNSVDEAFEMGTTVFQKIFGNTWGLSTHKCPLFIGSQRYT